MNAIGVISPYKYQGMWVFDDPDVGLSREPFVAGIDTMIDRLMALIPKAEKGFRLVFSGTPFPGHTVKLEWMREEARGNWYDYPQFGLEGWLVLRCTGISTNPLWRCICAQRPGHDDYGRTHPGGLAGS